MKCEKIPINDIVVSTRIRRNLGDIESLANSIKKLGLLSPLIINEENKLLAGERRLEACKLLGWDEVDVSIIPTADAENALDVEVAENRFRKDFTREELVNAGIEMERIEKVKAEERRMSTLKQNSTEAQNLAPRSESGKTRDIVAEKLGLSHTQYEREKFIVENKDLISPGEYDDWNNRISSTNKIFNAIKRILNPFAVKSPNEKDLKSKVSSLEAENKKLHENNVELASTIATKNEEIDSLLADSPENYYSVELGKLREEYYSLKQEHDNLKSEAAFSGVDLDFYKKKAESLEQENQHLRNQVSDITNNWDPTYFDNNIMKGVDDNSCLREYCRNATILFNKVLMKSQDVRILRALANDENARNEYFEFLDFVSNWLEDQYARATKKVTVIDSIAQ